MPRRRKREHNEYQRHDYAALPEELPALALGDQVIFPLFTATLTISNESQALTIDDAMDHGQMVALFAQPDSGTRANPNTIYEIGTLAKVSHIGRGHDDVITTTLTGLRPIRRVEFTQIEPYWRVRISPVEEHITDSAEVTALRRNLMDTFEQAVELSPDLPDDLLTTARHIHEPGQLAYHIAAVLNISPTEKQDVLATSDIGERLRKINAFATSELEILELGQRIKEQMHASIDRTQREYYLREQLKAIQSELGEPEGRESDVTQLRKTIDEAHLPPEAQREATRELDRLERMSPGSSERNVIVDYLEWLGALPWNRGTNDNLDVEHARRVLDEDHYDLERVKDRILEYLAVSKLRQGVKGPILAFVGPPGVGKTSLGQSIARSLGREFVRVSLGGIRDEAEIRGHRRTYVGAMPGRIIQGIRRANSNNPVFMLDEIDKLAISFQGDPAAALLEVLDPAQNYAFTDLYVGVPFDLSKVVFVATGNMTDTIPSALLDRMEVISLPGYTEADKIEIARRFLVSRQIQENGLTDEQLTISDTALSAIVSDYTQEAGVRNLERDIATICRRLARKIAEGSQERAIVTENNLSDYLGPPRFKREYAEKMDEIGVATGLAWTASGGAILPVEVSVIPGTGKLLLTGQLGEVMRESAMAAVTYARARSSILGIHEDFFEKNDIHIHLPAGAIPKDGPSAGVTMASALISALTRRPVASEVGMTGEITLRGKVLPIGGVREKVLAAHRAGLKTVILPEENKIDLDEVRGAAKQELNFIFVSHMDQVLRNALKSEQREEKVEMLLPTSKAAASPHPTKKNIKRTQRVDVHR